MPYSTSLLDWLDKMRGVHVLCVGDVMLDRYVYGAVDRVSPEAPIPVIQIEREDAMLGGVGNVVRNVAALGGSATIVAVRGDDEAGATIMELLANESRMRDEIRVDPGRRTTLKTRYVAGSQQLLRADHEAHQPLSGELVAYLLAAVAGALVDADVVVLSDYDKGVVTDDVIAGVVRHAGAAGKPVLVDPKNWRPRFAGRSSRTTPWSRPLRRSSSHATSAPCWSRVVNAACRSSGGTAAPSTYRSKRARCTMYPVPAIP
jgi:D-beta-D-heptose 7-phosphate kinase/D-beta-D-heptose 1-phosphate adenosyltransferase